MTDPSIELVGETARSVRVPNGYPVVERRIGFECASGEWIEALALSPDEDPASFEGVPPDARE